MAGGALMQVEFELTRDEYVAAAFSEASRRAPKRWQWLLLATLLALVLGSMGFLTLVTGGTSWMNEMPLLRPLLYALAVVLALILVVSVVRIALRRWVRALPRDEGAVLGWHRVTLAEEGVTDETRAGNTFVKWGGVMEIRDTDAFILIKVDRVVVHYVPKRAFASTVDAQQFLELARTRVAVGATSAAATGSSPS